MEINGNELIAACSDGTVKIFDLSNIGSISEAESSHKISNKSITCFQEFVNIYLRLHIHVCNLSGSLMN